MSTNTILALAASAVLALVLARVWAGEKAQSSDAAPTVAPAGQLADPAVLHTLGVPKVERVGGNMEIQAERRGENFYCGTAKITTPLPEGYPPPTPPGAIEIKDYPLVRRAQVTSTGSVNWGMNGAFWPLFRHIQRRDIEMTSPVEMDYKGLEPDAESRPESWTMSFLYRRVDQGPTGPDGKRVEVADLQPMTVASIGYQGEYSLSWVTEHLKKLTLWLEQNEATWERIGEPRAMFYNGPEVSGKRKWAEVQVPVRRRENAPAEPAAGEAKVTATNDSVPPGTGGACTPVPQE
jgi:hypothetical protein